MHGIGNDFVMFDPATSARIPELERGALAVAICNRKFGVGADGLIFLDPSEAADVRMTMLNPDGSESEMCGNGLRCVARLLGEAPATVRVETGGRVTLAERQSDGLVRVHMGHARIVDLEVEVQGYRGVSVDVGNPHFVTFVPSCEAVDLPKVGPLLEHDPAFPQRANIHFAEVVDARTLRQRTWERGAGVTLACGSGACAAAAASVALGLTGTEVRVHLPGGTLEIEVGEDSAVWMTGSAVTSFRGTWPREGAYSNG